MTSNVDRLTETGLVGWSGWSDLTFADQSGEAAQTVEALSIDPTYLGAPSATVALEDVDGEVARFGEWLTAEDHPTGLTTLTIYRMISAEEVQCTAVVVQCEDGDLLKIPEVAAILGFDPETVRRYTKDSDPGERIETIRVGKVGVRVRCEEVRAYLQRRMDEAQSGRLALRVEPTPVSSPAVVRAGQVRVYAPVRRQRRGSRRVCPGSNFLHAKCCGRPCVKSGHRSRLRTADQSGYSREPKRMSSPSNLSAPLWSRSSMRMEPAFKCLL